MNNIPTLDKDDLIGSCDDYLAARTGKYEWRRIRYRAALAAMIQVDLEDTDTVFDIGAGWTEFDYCLRTDGNSRCRYIPIDGAYDGADLETWEPPREAEFFVALELVEHLDNPERLIRAMQAKCRKGVILSTPNPETTDVLGMDPTHKTEITRDFLFSLGFNVYRCSFYGGEDDSFLAVYYPDGQQYDHQQAQEYIAGRWENKPKLPHTELTCIHCAGTKVFSLYRDGGSTLYCGDCGRDKSWPSPGFRHRR